jgi:hypothetical protein
MDPMIRRVSLVALLVTACNQVGSSPSPTPARELARGVAYTIDTTVLTQGTYDDSRPDPASGDVAAFQSFSARVTYANGRGRIDILTRRPGATVVANSVALTTPLGMPGDYYLFDSTGFVLVRPAAKTFSIASISHEAYGSYDSREGWPGFFAFQPSFFATLSLAAALDLPLKDRLNIYWHTDAGRTGFARGRIAIDNVPFGEMNIARWFGATRWLADFAATGRALPTDMTVTAAIPFRPSKEPGVPQSFIFKHPMSNAAVTDVDLSQLVLPPGLTHKPWAGDSPTQTGQIVPDQARWLTLPRRVP